MKSVIFQKPNIPSLAREGFMCIDSHCHTSFSDGKKLRLVLNQCKNKGIGVGITDHNEIKGAVEASRQDEIPIIPGIEINTSDGPHFLAYFYNISEMTEFYERFVKPKKYFNMRNMIGMSLLEATDILKNYNAVTCLPHPYAPLWANMNNAIIKNPENRKVISHADAIEVISGLQRKIANRKAHELQILFDKSPMGGSDCHGIGELGNCLTLARAENACEFLDEIRHKRTIAVGKEQKIRQKALYATRILRKNSKKIKMLISNKLFNNETG